MAYPVTLNGRTYTLADFEGTNYVEGLPDAFEDFVTHAGDIYNSTSTTSNTIGTGSKTFTVESAKPYQAGTPLRIADAAAPSTNFIDAIVTSYSGTTLVVDSVGYAGSGTFTSWNVNIGGSASVAGTVAIAQGGTGATTAAAARTNLDVYSKADADSRFLNVSGEASNVTMTGDVTIGDASSDTLSVPATASFSGGSSFSGGISGDVAFDTDTLYVDATNNEVGIGTSSPSATLNVSNDAGGSNSWTNAGSAIIINEEDTTRPASIKFGSTTASEGGQIVWGGAGGDGPFIFRNYSTERVRFDEDGRVLIATSSTAVNANEARLQLAGTTKSTSSNSIVRYSANSAPPHFFFGKTRSTTIGTVGTSVSDGDTLGYLAWAGDDGTDLGTVAGAIDVKVDGTPGENDMPGAMRFFTTNDGSQTPAERMRIANSGRVGINTVGESGAPTGWLTIDNDINSADILTNKASYHISLGLDGGNTDHYIGGIGFGDITQTTIQAAISAVDNGTSAATGLAFATGNTSTVTEAMRINSSQRVLIGQTDARNSFFNNNVGTYNPRFQIEANNTSGGARMMSFVLNDDSNNAFIQIFGRSRGTTANSLTAVAEDDNLGVISWQGATGVGLTEAAQIKAEVDGSVAAADMPGRLVFRTTSDGASSSTERMRISEDGTVSIGIGANHPSILRLRQEINTSANTGTGVLTLQGASSTYSSFIGMDATGLSIGLTSTSRSLRFVTNSSTRVTIDTSGNLLVGKETADFGTAGIALMQTAQLRATRNGAVASFNRIGSDGDVAEFYGPNGLIGRIRSEGDDLVVGTNGDCGIRFNYTNATGADFVAPCRNTGALRDNAIDLGTGSGRWDDVHATNGTIQTSDQNEKQQISSLTDAEITAAKAISQLFKTFKWNDAVAKKGDAARTHTGVIAQDVEQAMSDSGLNAGDYAFFINTTWWEADETFTDDDGVESIKTNHYFSQDDAPEGATERTRKGIRYPELLSFIGAATEQRLASIEARLDALET